MSSPHAPPASDPAALSNPLIAEAVALARAGQFDAAGAHFFTAYRRSPRLLGCARNALECAQRLASQGTSAPAARAVHASPAPGTLSFIVCSIRPQRLAWLQRDLERHLAGHDWELVHIDDARSLCEGYSRGLQRARGELLVFCHDDIGIVCDDFAGRLRRALSQYDVVGVAGCDRLTGPMWAWSGIPHGLAWVSYLRPDGTMRAALAGPGPILENADALDGVFIAARREAVERIGFDADTFDGFHFYDLDFSYRAARAGLRCAVVAEIALWHASAGDFNSPAWGRYAQRFVQKFPQLAPQQPFDANHFVTLDGLAPPMGTAIYAWVAHWSLLSAERESPTV